MKEEIYISVILPLKLDWEPCYKIIPDSDRILYIEIGTRVLVKFSNREYIGVISAIDITPDIDKKKIIPILKIEDKLEIISMQEIMFWRKIADYYLCTTGEVYKAAYPTLKTGQEITAARVAERKVQQREKLDESFKERISRIKVRLENKIQKYNKTTGPKTKESLEKDISKYRIELENAQKAYHDFLTKDGSPKENPTPDVRIIRQLDPLSNSQKKAFDEIKQAFSENKPALLHGVTGAGKTEIYMHLASESLKNGKNVLYLVPEIAMSMQLEVRLKTFFKKNLLVFHSKETHSSRAKTAEEIRTCSNNYLLLGTRSALFLPHHNLGLIIIDEEHDNSYKQDSPEPKYNGRDSALMLSMFQEGNCHTVLGSATPSLESLYNCWCGKFRKVELKEKFFQGDLPDIEIIDTIAERKKRGMVGNFSRKLIDKIERTLSKKEQVIILRARRSYSPVLQCQNCGSIPKCPHCNVSMSWSKAGNKMICHYCGYSKPYDGKCPNCAGELKTLGSGTQKIEEEAIKLFPNARISRLDSDSAQNKNFEKRVIKDFSEGRTDILIGTQIIAKGFDFENVTTVVLLQADAILGIEDFRADEKALQLMEQLRGRCGRREKKGEFIIQTSQAGHPIYSKLAQERGNELYEELMNERKDFNFPPFTRIIGINIKDKYEERAERMAWSLAATLKGVRTQNGKALDITGPYSPTIDKIADNHIRHIRINLQKDRQLGNLKKLIYKLIEDFCRKKKYSGHISIDVDPI